MPLGILSALSFKTLLADEQTTLLHVMGVQHWAMLEPKVAPPLLTWVVKGQVTPEHVGAQHVPAAVAISPREIFSGSVLNAVFNGQDE